jgi:hypothetical protein
MKKSAKKAVRKPAVSSTPAKTVKAPAKKSAAPAKKKVAVPTELPATFITAKIDIGFGNHLFIRGNGPGLSWDKGIKMECIGAGLWTVSVRNAKDPVIFKVLVNDLSWSSGSDYVAEPGQNLTVSPSF